MAKGQVIPLNWQASPEEIDYGIKLGFSAFEVKEMAEDMRLWALSNRNRTVARKADWHLTFLGWMRRQKQRTQSPHEKSYAEIADDIRNGSGDD